MRAEATAHLQSAAQERDKSIEQTRDQLRQEAQRVRRQLRRLMQEAERGQSWREANQTATNIGREISDDDWMASTDSEDNTSASRPKGKKRKSAPAAHQGFRSETACASRVLESLARSSN